jgi:hypothetical protein
MAAEKGKFPIDAHSDNKKQPGNFTGLYKTVCQIK